MEGLYRTPLRVYLILGVLSLIGLFAAFQLPISLFPNSTKPSVHICIRSELAPENFERLYGTNFESQLRTISGPGLEVERVRSTYSNSNNCYDLDFRWGGAPDRALREVQTTVNALSSVLPLEARRSVNVWSNDENSGFLALSFYSQKRSLTEVYKILEPILGPQLAKVTEANDAGLWNPQHQQVQIELKPDAMAAFQLFPEDISTAINRLFDSYGAGSVTVGANNFRIVFPSNVNTFDKLKQMTVTAHSGQTVALADIANVDLTIPLDSARTFKTSGSPSIILFAQPKPGGNIKKMAEDVIELIKKNQATWPKDIEYKTLVDPSEFIRSAVNNVSHEVFLAAFLAVIILFLFIGNLRNVITAAIEIPISIVLAFILMRLSGMNLNLISLGGLALSAGMNVDASVVVMENIFRHFEEITEPLDFEARVRVVVGAVNEVKFSVIASTVASLVVFIPLAFTSDLSYAILGDLAKAVVFSHGFSAVVALVLVPTIRLHLMGHASIQHQPSPLEKFLKFLETRYVLLLEKFLAAPKLKPLIYGCLSLSLILLVSFVVPRLPREVIGKPDTDWLTLSINTRGNTLNRQMEGQAEETESNLLEKLGSHIQYTFTQVNRPNSAFIMLRLKEKRETEQLWKEMEGLFPNSPFISYWIEAWNPSELPIPNPPDFLLTVRGSEVESMAEVTRDLSQDLKEKKIFGRLSVDPSADIDENILVRPKVEQWPVLAKSGVRFLISDLADLIRTATNGKWVANFPFDGDNLDVYLRFPQEAVASLEDIASLPIGIGQKIVPVKALAQVKFEQIPPTIYLENGRRLFTVSGHMDKGDEGKADAARAAAAKVVEGWQQKLSAKAQDKAQPTISIDDAKVELNDALRQLLTAVSLSIALIFLTMVFQFGSVMNALLVLVAVPLGFIGVVCSLWVFHSTISLNSMLGVILLNGIAVANSIILVDFLQKAVREGQAPRTAALHVAQIRLRPILMTSLTTALGMLPIALGLGEGGKILQPLGIAVVGGLGFSMVTTLFIVPALQVSYLEWHARKGNLLHATLP